MVERRTQSGSPLHSVPCPLGAEAEMPCFVGCLALAMPRLTILLVVLLSDYIGRAYESLLWPILGFFFMPLTTLAYA